MNRVLRNFLVPPYAGPGDAAFAMPPPVRRRWRLLAETAHRAEGAGNTGLTGGAKRGEETYRVRTFSLVVLEEVELGVIPPTKA